MAQVMPILRKPPVLIGIGAAFVFVLVLAFWPKHGSAGSASAKDLKLKQQAQDLWQNRQFDESEQIWRQLAAVKGPLQPEANRQIADIEQKRADVQRQLDSGTAMLADKKDCAGAQQAFQSVVDANLWHAEDGAKGLADAKACVSAGDIHKQEQDLFDQAIKLFQAKDYEGARKGFRSVLDLNVPNSTLKPQVDGYLGKIHQMGSDQKLFDTAVQDLKDENWAEARDQFQELIKKKGPLSGDAKKQLPAAENALGAVNTVEGSIRGGAFRTAKTQLDSVQQWKKTHDKLANELHTAEQQQFDAIKGSAQAVESKGDGAAIQHAIDELHGFESRAEDASILSACKDIERRLNTAYSTASEKAGDRAAFEAAVAHFTQAQQKKDTEALSHAVSQEFQKIAKGNGIYRDQALLYVNSTIPTAIQALTQTAGKVVLAALSCGPGKAAQEVPSVSGSVSCAQLDPNPPLQWVGIPMVDLPDSAKEAGKLPYSMNVILTIEPNGNVKIDKEGNADKDFFKKAKDASKHWKTTAPRSEGKPVTVRFLYTITFQR
jgi:TolA-binding protein